MAIHSSTLIPSSFGGAKHSKPKLLKSCSLPSNPPPLVSFPYRHRHRKALRISASVSVSNPEVRTGSDDLVASILSKVTQTDRGVLLKNEEHKEVAAVAEESQKYCVNEPVKCRLIFGVDVVYCSVPTSPGGGYWKMIQVVDAPETVRNKVSFSAFGFLDGEVSLTDKIVFERPELKIGALEFRYGGHSEVKLQITYINDKIRLGKGSRGSLFVFQGRN
ncbi:hypothetical protein I3843_08G018800 [Carya illinoinensis]|uniref:Plastid lipid-associated protein/fibrillin conserved domain-containing protein n=1 Tax=Carya illinoinensis TaxID=32201 RepID=A0A8T1PU97_CARIL|nr:hypothetical protein I3760_08G018300 [Carya illinoinensis]KAG6643890.1 hypothetical protein CIPAW_08G017800 [Carya illinoinensis]KAG6698403.1 hypothetical protein I3842_08G018100 [Carya illinoinensis]KAG7965804.1 hypothetical protein I3843_08G018800 [Carya illinoinensis]